MINKVKTIIRAKLYSKYAMKNEEWYKDRLEACRKCELNSINKKEKSIREKLLFFLNFLNPFCTVCGCEIKAKASEIREVCPKNNWKNI